MVGEHSGRLPGRGCCACLAPFGRALVGPALQDALWEATAMAPHIRFFEASLLAPLARDQRGALAAKARDVQDAAKAGDISW